MRAAEKRISRPRVVVGERWEQHDESHVEPRMSSLKRARSLTGAEKNRVEFKLIKNSCHESPDSGIWGISPWNNRNGQSEVYLARCNSLLDICLVYLKVSSVERMPRLPMMGVGEESI